MVGVHQWIACARRDAIGLHGRPRSPRIIGDVDRERLAPVSIDLRGRDPLPVQVARLHRVLRPVPLQDRLRSRRVVGPCVPGAIFQRRSELTLRHTCEPHVRTRVRSVCITAFALQVLFEGVAEHVGVVGITRYCVAVDRGDTAVGCCPEIEPGERLGVVDGEPCACRMPSESVGRARLVAVLLHLCPKDVDLAANRFATHRPEPRRNPVLAGAGLERRRRLDRSAVKESETRSVLHHRRVVIECGGAEARRGTRVIDEGVLKDPQVPAGAERIHVLVIHTDDGTHPVAEERVQRRGRSTRRATEIGRHIPTIGDSRRISPRRDHRRGRGRHWLGNRPADPR